MTAELDAIIRGVRAEIPDVTWEQVRVMHPADDDGLWFFRRDGIDVQLESPGGMCPFVVEGNRPGQRVDGRSVDEVVDVLIRWLSE
jgi:hypothetical protein